MNGPPDAKEAARRLLHEQLRVVSLEAYGCEHLPLAVRAAGALLQFALGMDGARGNNAGERGAPVETIGP